MPDNSTSKKTLEQEALNIYSQGSTIFNKKRIEVEKIITSVVERKRV